jgi:hypothetical protein
VGRFLTLRPFLRRPETRDVVAKKSDDATVGVNVDNSAAVATVEDARLVVANVGNVDANVGGFQGSVKAQNIWRLVAN